MGASSALNSITVSVESVVGAAGGLVGGLIVGGPVGGLLNVSAPMATSILAVMAIATPFVAPKMKKDLKSVFYGLGVGLGSATVLRLIQPLFAAPTP
jgi:molybdopterin-guanine dinucleotide biosynthesis protein A